MRQSRRQTSIPEAFDTWATLIDETDLTNIQKNAIKTRVISVVMRLRARLRRLSVAYTCLRTTTTVGSLLVPSILTLQSPTQPVTQPQDGFSAYWAIWGIGLVVSVSNAFVSLFRVDKNYYTVGNLLEKIESEAWLYLTQSGPYNPEHNPEHDEEEGRNLTQHTGHRSRFKQFIEKCEILINKAVRSEYATGFKSNGTHTTSGSSTAPTDPIPTRIHNGEFPYLREAPSVVAGLYHPTTGSDPPSSRQDSHPASSHPHPVEPNASDVNIRTHDPRLTSNVPNPVDDTRRSITSQSSSHRGGHPVSSISGFHIHVASDSTEEGDTGRNGQPKGVIH